MQKAVVAARILLGLIFTVFGLNFYFRFLPTPELNEAAGSFLGALVNTGYMMEIVKLVEVVGGVMLLAGVFVPLALVLLFPIVLNIFLFHIVLDLAGWPIAVLVMALELFLAWAYRGSFKGMLSRTAQPG